MSAILTTHLDLQAIKDRHPLADVVEASGVALRGRGRVRQGRCPFHDESLPSFTVYGDTQRFYCFGCGAMGDVVDYVQRVDGLTFQEVLAHLGGATIAPTRIARASVRSVHCAPAVRDVPLLTAVVRFYQRCLWHSRDAQAYLAERGIEPATAWRLRLGFAPGARLRERLASLGFDGERIERSGLFLGDAERFAGKIVVPELHRRGVTWLVGRGIDGSEPRFQALPGEKPLLGLNRLRGCPAVVLAEGLFDWLALVQWGVPSCCALGGHGGERLAAALVGFRQVYLAFDSDDAGGAATEKVRGLLGAKAVAVSMPPGVKDVAELAVRRGGARAFMRLLAQAARRVGKGSAR